MDVTLKRQKRKIYFIEKSFQRRFILKFCALVFLGGVLTMGIIYLLAMRFTTVSIVNSRVIVRTTADFLLPVLIQTLAVVMIIIGIATIFLTLFFSHKIAGPLYRFKKGIQSLSEGDFSSDFRIRHLDQLQGLAFEFNNMILKLRAEINGLKDNTLSLCAKSQRILEQEINEQKRPMLNELKTIAEELNKKIGYFKT